MGDYVSKYLGHAWTI